MPQRVPSKAALTRVDEIQIVLPVDSARHANAARNPRRRLVPSAWIGNDVVATCNVVVGRCSSEVRDEFQHERSERGFATHPLQS